MDSNCKEFKFSSHALKQMFARKISVIEAISVAREGEIVAEYPEDNPFPSFLLFKMIDNRPIHAVLAVDSENKFCIFVTLYEPTLEIWMNDYKTRREL
ncbi:MAG: hypothetical protein COW85_09200 [Ignavibacteria bacterium CG22_combo_CG10-13_8_21_14_all_37_15]|nr:MAG: hypothetical protein COW85_09200 [Ignavibacteria bacterium CG22_combo_CG10-13_8_21_14_all_37_15]